MLTTKNLEPGQFQGRDYLNRSIGFINVLMEKDMLQDKAQKIGERDSPQSYADYRTIRDEAYGVMVEEMRLCSRAYVVGQLAPSNERFVM